MFRLIILIFVFLTAVNLYAISMLHTVAEQDYIDLAAPYDAVGRIMTSSDSGTGTLVSPTKILTAAHVIDGNEDGIIDGPINEILMRFGADVDVPDHTVGFSSASLHPLWTATPGNSAYDLAVLTLSVPFTLIEPLTLSLLSPLNLVGTMVGYGDHGTGLPPFEESFDGKRRAARNVIDFVGVRGGPNPGFFIMADFDSPTGDTNTFGSPIPLALEGMVASGDSGGPLLVTVGGSETVVGVAGFGEDSSFGKIAEYGALGGWVPINEPNNIAYLQDNGITVPEPGTYALVVSIICLLFLFQRRRHRM